MVLNYIWIFFFLIGFLVALIDLFLTGNTEVFNEMLTATFSSSKTGFEIALGLTGVLALWMGLMKIGEKAGVIQVFARIIGPFFHRLFPEIPKNHPVNGSIVMNIAANMLGLDNAATPIGLKAMNQMQEFNPQKDTASNAQIMFLVLNTSGLTVIPVSIMVYRAEMGAANPADIFLPILIATSFSTLVGLLAVSAFQRINLFNKVVLAYLGVFIALLIGLIAYFTSIPKEEIGPISSFISSFLLLSIIVSFIGLGWYKKINAYDAFIEGAKEGFGIAIKIIPYLVAILVAIAVFRASGAMDFLQAGLASFFKFLNVNTDFIDAVPTALMKPLSGTGARGMMIDVMNTHGADSFVGRVASTVQGSTDTTFYVIALYFGSVGIKRTRHALAAGLMADFAGIIAAIVIAYIFFH